MGHAEEGQGWTEEERRQHERGKRDPDGSSARRQLVLNAHVKFVKWMESKGSEQYGHCKDCAPWGDLGSRGET